MPPEKHNSKFFITPSTHVKNIDKYIDTVKNYRNLIMKRRYDELEKYVASLLKRKLYITNYVLTAEYDYPTAYTVKLLNTDRKSRKLVNETLEAIDRHISLYTSDMKKYIEEHLRKIGRYSRLRGNAFLELVAYDKIDDSYIYTLFTRDYALLMDVYVDSNTVYPYYTDYSEDYILVYSDVEYWIEEYTLDSGVVYMRLWRRNVPKDMEKWLDKTLSKYEYISLPRTSWLETVEKYILGCFDEEERKSLGKAVERYI